MTPNWILRFSLGLVLAALVVGVPATTRAGANVVPNPGFEDGPCSSVPGGPGSIVCNWGVSGGRISRTTENPHSGEASLRLECLTAIWCVDPVSLRADTKEGQSCALVGPGVHPGSFWYRTNTAWVQMQGDFYEAPNCTGAAHGRAFADWAIPDGEWHEVTGELVAPAGTQSAYFFVRMYIECTGLCLHPWANFDDVDFESGTLPGPLVPASEVVTQTDSSSLQLQNR
jgi:hypothetical protein